MSEAIPEWPLLSELRALKAEFHAFKDLMAERDRRYEERDQANKDAIRAAFASAEKASEKTESALKEYKVGANEWRDTVKDLIGNLRESRSEGSGEGQGRFAVRADVKWAIGLVAGAIAGYILSHLVK